MVEACLVRDLVVPCAVSPGDLNVQNLVALDRGRACNFEGGPRDIAGYLEVGRVDCGDAGWLDLVDVGNAVVSHGRSPFVSWLIPRCGTRNRSSVVWECPCPFKFGAGEVGGGAALFGGGCRAACPSEDCRCPKHANAHQECRDYGLDQSEAAFVLGVSLVA